MSALRISKSALFSFFVFLATFCAASETIAGSDDEITFGIGPAGITGYAAYLHKRGFSGYVGFDTPIARNISGGIRISYSEFNGSISKPTYYEPFGIKSPDLMFLETSAKLTINSSTLSKRSAFVHAVIGMFVLPLGKYDKSELGGGVGGGFRVPFRRRSGSRFIVESTYYTVKNYRFLTVRLGFGIRVP